MDYKDKFKQIKTFEGLFDFRQELLDEQSKQPSLSNKTDFNECWNINFWLNRVEERIKYLEAQGHKLDKIENDLPKDIMSSRTIEIPLIEKKS